MISVVIPAHNEAELLEATVTEVVLGLETRSLSFEVIVVENGSTDRTGEIADELAGRLQGVRLLRLRQADYGAALRAGLLAATGDTVVNFDADYYDIGFLDRALLVLAGPPGAAVVVGSKRALGAEDRRAPLRRLVTLVFALVLRIVFRLGVSDTHGMKALDRAAVAPLAARCRFGQDLFDTELILRAERAGLRTAEIPVAVAERRPSRSTILSRLPRTLRGLVRLRLALWREGRGGSAPLP